MSAEGLVAQMIREEYAEELARKYEQAAKVARLRADETAGERDFRLAVTLVGRARVLEEVARDLRCVRAERLERERAEARAEVHAQVAEWRSNANEQAGAGEEAR